MYYNAAYTYDERILPYNSQFFKGRNVINGSFLRAPKHTFPDFQKMHFRCLSNIADFVTRQDFTSGKGQENREN